MTDFDQSRIERLKRALYSRDPNRVPQEKRTPISERGEEVPRDWGTRASFDMPLSMVSQKNNSFFTKFLGVSLVFFCAALGIALFIFFGGLNMISSNNVDVKIVGPSTVASGEELDAGIVVVNQNRTDLQSVSLYIDYPDGATAPGTNAALSHDKIDLGTIAPGKDTNYGLRAILFGQTGAVKTMHLRIEYTVKGSTAVFSKEKTYDVSIGSSPLIMNVFYPQVINSGQTVTLSIDLTSNSSVVVPQVLVKVDFPYGFTYTDSNIKPLRSGVWNIGDLKNGSKKTLTISGTLIGQDLEERSFAISAGTQSTDASKDFDTELAVSNATVAIHKSFFDLTLTSNGSATPVAHPGDMVPITIAWQNTLPQSLVGDEVDAVFSGNAFDRSLVSPGGGGFYRSLDSTAVWNQSTTQSLAEISPLEQGQVYVSLGTLSASALKSVRNPHVDVTVNMTGNRSGSDGTTVTSQSQITIKLASDLALSSKSYRAVGPFTNTGPIPPAADQTSTYTITWTLSNTTNDLTSGVVSATLPPTVQWTGQTSPASERISYDPSSRQVVWNVGNIAAGTGYTYSPRTVSFQVSITPSLTDRGQPITLLSGASARAMDSYTSTTVGSDVPQVSTRYTDPGFTAGNDTVK